MKTRIIYTKIWKDDYFAALGTTEKLLFVYLLTNERVNICGTYEITDRELSFDLGFTTEELDVAKAKLQADKRFVFYPNWVSIINYAKYQTFKGEKNEKCCLKELSLIPDELKEALNKYPIHRVSPEEDTLRNQKLETINQKPEIKEPSPSNPTRDFKGSIFGDKVKADMKKKGGVKGMG